MSVVMHRANSRTVRGKSVYASKSHGSSHAGPHDLGKRMSGHKIENRLGSQIRVGRSGGKRK